MNHPDKDWDWYDLSANPSVATWEIVQKYPDICWEWFCSPRVATWKFGEKHPYICWRWSQLSSNPRVATWDILQKYPEKPWDWVGVSHNPHFTWDLVEKHPNKHWHWGYICYNPTLLAREKYIQDHVAQPFAEWFRQSDLKRELMEKMWHPRNFDKWRGWGLDEEMDE
jgi:hypothetical protein